MYMWISTTLNGPKTITKMQADSQHLPSYLSTYLSTYLPIYLSTYLPIYLFTYVAYVSIYLPI